jgi:hypothetical protein
LTKSHKTSAVLKYFAQLVERFCALVDGHTAMAPDDFLRQVHLSLAQLYATALALPAVEVIGGDDDDEQRQTETADDRLGHERWMVLYRSLVALIGDREHYSEVFDAYAEPPEEPVMGSLADDVADIHQDLADGLLKWRRGDEDGALWAWRFHFTFHWGEHATSALRALHVLASTHNLGFPSSGFVDE